MLVLGVIDRGILRMGAMPLAPMYFMTRRSVGSKKSSNKLNPTTRATSREIKSEYMVEVKYSFVPGVRA
jgi:hypothetical protein